MDNLRRSLLLKVMDGDPMLAPVMWHFDKLIRCDEVLRWCVSNGLVGKRFMSFYEEHGCSILRSASYILKRINAETISGKVMAGRDYHAGS